MGRVVVEPVKSINGEIEVPGDKSISHRAVILGSIGEGNTEVQGILESEDTLRTIEAFRIMGIDIDGPENGDLVLHGRGVQGLKEPFDIIFAGNSGTTLRILSGLLSGQRFFSVLTGDSSLRKRPMKRVVRPLRMMGARIWGREGGDFAPLAILGGELKSVNYLSPVSSAQVKSAILFAALYAHGTTIIEEPVKSRDHTERILARFGADIKVEGNRVHITSGCKLSGQKIRIPGDISSAAFFIIASLILPNSSIFVKGVGINPTRFGIISLLKRMGAFIEVKNKREESGEPVGDILVRSSPLKGIDVGPDEIPLAIDEIPIFCVAASLAEGKTTITGASELRVKESDRIAVMAQEFSKLGARIEEKTDGMVIHGVKRLKGARCYSHDDHRIAMALIVAGLAAKEETIVEGTESINTSFPGFMETIERVVVR